MTRVLQVVSCLELGGTETFIMNHYRAMDSEVCQFDFMVFLEKEYPYLEEIRRMGGNVFFSGPPALGNLPAFLKNACRIMREHGPYDAVHSHVNIDNGWVLLAAAMCGVRVRVSHSHGTDGKDGPFPVRVYRCLEELLLRAVATKPLACGQQAGEYLYGRDWFRRHGACVRNSISLERFFSVDAEETNALREAFRIPGDCGLVLGNITRLDLNKNPLFTLEVFARVLEKVPGAVLLLGGPDGGQLEETKARAATLGIAEQVRFIGPRRDIPACLALMDGYIFPSLFEGLPIAILEAQAAGCACFASAGVSSEADMGLGAVRYLSLEESPDVWAKEIISGVRTYERPGREMVEAAFARQGYDLRTTAGQLLEIYSGK